MTPVEFLKSIKAGKIDRLYLFTGEETYLQQECLHALLTALIPDESFHMLNFSEYSVATRSLGEVLAVANQFPMMTASRLVVARDFDKASDAELEALKNYIRRPNPSSVLVFQTSDLDKRRSLSTILLKSCTVVACSRLSDPEAVTWVQQQAKRQGVQFTPPALGQLIGMCGTDLHTLSNEIEKLALYVGRSGMVTPQDVEAITVRSREHSNFDLSDAILAGDAKKALKLLHRLLGQGQEPVALVGMLAWLYRQMLTAYDLMQSNAPREEIARELKMHPGRAINFLTAVRRKSEAEIRRGMIRLAEVDVALKSSHATPRLQLEMLLCELLEGKR